MTEITSRQNPLVQHVAKLLAQAKYRRERGEFAAEGTKLLDDAVEAGVEITAVLATAEVAGTLERSLPITVVSDRLFGAISTQRAPQGAIFAARIPDVPARDGAKIALDGVQDAGNVGTVIRTAAALGIGEVLLVGDCADPFGYKAVRASMGGVFRVRTSRMTAAELLETSSGLKLMAAEPRADAADVRELPPNALPVIGSEGQGLSKEVLEMCEGSFAIPMSGSTESLNAAVAAAIVIWEISGRRG